LVDADHFDRDQAEDESTHPFGRRRQRSDGRSRIQARDPFALLRSRFGIAHNLRLYTEEELMSIIERASTRLQLPTLGEDAIRALARRSRGTPRVALRLLRRARDFVEVRAGGTFSFETVAEALTLERIDNLGLDDLDRAYLRAIAEIYEGGPVGVDAIAASLGEDAGTLEDMVEPYLLQIGFLARTRQGRCLTARASDHLGTPDFPASPQLFDR
ncbi:MAG: Holliday junction DNA helicase RuvB C-terminal domain-containing protein, partial [Planctomycetota bacterium]